MITDLHRVQVFPVITRYFSILSHCLMRASNFTFSPCLSKLPTTTKRIQSLKTKKSLTSKYTDNISFLRMSSTIGVVSIFLHMGLDKSTNDKGVNSLYPLSLSLSLPPFVNWEFLCDDADFSDHTTRYISSQLLHHIFFLNNNNKIMMTCYSVCVLR